MENTVKWALAILVIIVIVSAIAMLIGPTLPAENVIENKTPIQEKTISKENIKEFNITAKQWKFDPDTITVNKGDTVRLNIKSIDVAHGFSLPDFGINKYLEPGKTITVEFVADKTGEFLFLCSVYCGQGHGNMIGKIIVK